MSYFGIDLGTTNSLICNKEMQFTSELVPSCVEIETGKAGVEQYENIKAKRSFKTDMSMGDEGTMPRVASKYVLMELRNIAQRLTTDAVKDVVISVPAYFSDNQRQATVKAAEQAGLIVRGLVNEPTAAAIHITQNRKGLYLVFDLGGGTFDVSLIDSRFGIYDVQATDGLKRGGDDFDRNIFKFLVKKSGVPLFRLSKEEQAKLLHQCTKHKVRMQKERSDFDIDLSEYNGGVVTFTQSDYIALMKITFTVCLNCLDRLRQQSVQEGEIVEILLVGGSTRCPYLREWIEEVTGIAPAALTYDPDKVVAQGAADYAAIVEQGLLNEKVSDVTKQLSIRLNDGTAKPLIYANSKIPLKESELFYNPEPAHSLELKLLQGDGLMAVDMEEIGQLVWDYDRPMPANEGAVIVELEVTEAGIIKFSVKELLKEPISVELKRNLS